jgi:hypothetical protein
MILKKPLSCFATSSIDGKAWVVWKRIIKVRTYIKLPLRFLYSI